MARPVPYDAPLEDYPIDFKVWLRNAPKEADGYPTRQALIGLMLRVEAEMPTVEDIAWTNRLWRTLIDTKHGHKSRTFRDALRECEQRQSA